MPSIEVKNILHLHILKNLRIYERAAATEEEEKLYEIILPPPLWLVFIRHAERMVIIAYMGSGIIMPEREEIEMCASVDPIGRRDKRA